MAAQEAALEVHVDSAGTGNWHVGRAPDPRARAVALRHGCDIGHHRARQVAPGDFWRFTHILALDGSNLADLRRIAPTRGTARLSLLLDSAPGRRGQSVADPYYGGDSHFEQTWRDVTFAAQALVRQLRDGG